MVCISMNVMIPPVIFAHHIYKCSSYIKSNGYNWEIIVIVLMIYVFYHVTLVMVIPHTLANM